MLNPVSDSVPEPVLVRVTVCAVLLVPTRCAPNVREDGLNAALSV